MIYPKCAVHCWWRTHFSCFQSVQHPFHNIQPRKDCKYLQCLQWEGVKVGEVCVCEWEYVSECVWLRSERNRHRRRRRGSTGHSVADGGRYIEERDVDKAQPDWEWTNSRISPRQSHTPGGNVERQNCLKRSVGKSVSQKWMQVLRRPGGQWEKRRWIWMLG